MYFQETMKDQSRKKVVLGLRWMVIIVTSYLILFGKGEIRTFDIGKIFILIYIFSNCVLTFFPQPWFSNLKFFYLLVICDIGTVSLGMYLSGKGATNFYLVFFSSSSLLRQAVIINC